MSFGTSVYSEALERAVKDAYKADILMAGAAGNEGGSVEYPAAFDEVMAVAAADPEAEISAFSNTGEELEIAAPGEKILTTGFFDGCVVTHGTSIAVPHVSGAASVLWERDLTKSNDFIRQLICSSAKEISGTDECGLLDVGYAMEHYEEFAESYEEGAPEEELIQENTEKPLDFGYVEEDEAYAEGRWHGGTHKEMVSNANDKTHFSAEIIKIIREGAVYPDNPSSGWSGSDANPWWHGKWRYVVGSGETEVNYVAVLDMITTVAAYDGADISGFKDTDYKLFDGLNQKIFNEIRADIKDLKSQFMKVMSGMDVNNTKANRKYFLYGCALHSISDTFAHSTTREDGVFIDHSQDNKIDADNVEYYGRRDNIAAAAVLNCMLAILNYDVYCDGEEVLKAVVDQYGAAKFKIIKIKKYLNENGYSDPILSKVTISAPR